MFLTRHGLQFKLFPKLEHVQGPPHANQVVQNGMQAHTAGLHISTTHSGSIFTKSLILHITTEYQGIKTSFYSILFSDLQNRNRAHFKELAVRV